MGRKGQRRKPWRVGVEGCLGQREGAPTCATRPRRGCGTRALEREGGAERRPARMDNYKNERDCHSIPWDYPERPPLSCGARLHGLHWRCRRARPPLFASRARRPPRQHRGTVGLRGAAGPSCRRAPPHDGPPERGAKEARRLASTHHPTAIRSSTFDATQTVGQSSVFMRRPRDDWPASGRDERRPLRPVRDATSSSGAAAVVILLTVPRLP